MKNRLLSVITLAALSFAACDKTEDSVPTPPTPLTATLTITSETPVAVPSEGGDVSITFTIENPVEGESVTAVLSDSWGRVAAVNEDSVDLTFDPNDTHEVRFMTVTLSYDDKDYLLSITQAASPVEPVVGVEFSYLSGIYYGSDYGATENDYCYGLVLSMFPDVYDLVSGDVAVYPNSQYLFLDLYSSVPSDNYTIEFRVPAGTYTLDPESSATAGTLGGEYTYLYTTTEEEGFKTDFVSGEVVVTENMIVAKFVGGDGEEYFFYCKQTVVDNHDTFGSGAIPGEFSTLEGDLEIPFEDGGFYAENVGDYYVLGQNTWLFCIDDYSTGESLVFELLADASLEIPVGTFEVSKDIDRKNIALPGYVDGYGESMWSWYYLYDETGYDVVGAAPIKSGTLTIVDNGDYNLTATFELRDDLDNKISGSCTGVIDVPYYGSMSQMGKSKQASRSAVAPRKHKSVAVR